MHSGEGWMDLNSMKDKANELLAEHGDKVEGAAAQAGEFVKDRFGHDEHVDMVVDKIKDAVPGFDSSDSPEEQPPPETPGQPG